MVDHEIGYSYRPITQSKKIVTGKPLQAQFSEVTIAKESVVLATGLYARDSHGNSSTEFFDGSKERSRTRILDLRAEAALYLLYLDPKVGMKVPTNYGSTESYGDREVVEWSYKDSILEEIATDVVSGVRCRRLRVLLSRSDVKTDVCVSDSLQAVIQERTESADGIYIWQLENIRAGDENDKPFTIPTDFRIVTAP